MNTPNVLFHTAEFLEPTQRMRSYCNYRVNCFRDGELCHSSDFQFDDEAELNAFLATMNRDDILPEA